MKLTRMVLANAFALTTGIFWVICGLFIWLLPDFSLTVTRWWFMGFDISSLGRFSLDFGTFLLGGITAIVSAWATGYVLGWSIEYFSKSK